MHFVSFPFFPAPLFCVNRMSVPLRGGRSRTPGSRPTTTFRCLGRTRREPTCRQRCCRRSSVNKGEKNVGNAIVNGELKISSFGTSIRKQKRRKEGGLINRFSASTHKLILIYEIQDFFKRQTMSLRWKNVLTCRLPGPGAVAEVAEEEWCPPPPPAPPFRTVTPLPTAAAAAAEEDEEEARTPPPFWGGNVVTISF